MKKKLNAVIATATPKGIVYRTDVPSQKWFERYEESCQEQIPSYNEKIHNTQNSVYLNMVQRTMYRRLMYGLNEFSKEELLCLPNSVIAQITDDYKKAKRAVHVIKSKKLYGAETKLIAAMTNKPTLGQNDYDWYLDIPKDFTLKKLRISTKEIIDDFIRRKLLPKNFYDLSPQTIKI